MSKSIIWKIVSGYEDYEISKCGIVRNFKTKKVLKQNKSGSNKNYLSVSLWKNKKCCGPKYVHRLVITTFNRCSVGNEECAHLDGNSKNNNLNNLKWVTPKENASHKKKHGTYYIGDKHKGCKVNDFQCYEIINMYINNIRTEDISKIFNISHFTINHMLKGKRKSLILSDDIKHKINETKVNNKMKAAIGNLPWKK